MTALAEQVLGTIRKRRLLEAGDRVLVAVSGGCDSVMLLRLLHELAPGEGWRLEVAHFNHRLRGAEADADEEWVQDLAERLGLPCHTDRGDVQEFARETRGSIEMAARELRHRFLARTAAGRGIGKVALGHHADDQVETFFLRLLRGTSAEGAAGMRWIAPSPADAGISLVRPLLDRTREELRRAAHEADWAWREDSTNSAPDALRNRIRHELIPLLVANYQPALGRVIRRFMEIAGSESAYAAEGARAWLEGAGREEFGGLPPALRRQALLLQLRQLGVSADFGLVETLFDEAGARVEVTAGRRVWRDEAGRVHEDAMPSIGFEAGRLGVELAEPAGEVEFDGARFRWEFSERNPNTSGIPPRRSGEEWVDAEALGRRILLRHWQPGDRFQPIGLASPAKLQDLFVNAKVPRDEKHKRIVAETEQGVLFWVEGLRIGEVGKVQTRTRRLLRWTWERLAGK